MVFSWLHLAIVLFLLGGLLFAVGPLILAVLLAPKAKGGDLGMPYECGMRPHGPSWIKFGITYYVYALIFLAFDVDVLYLFPVATHYPATVGWVAFVKVFIFLFFLVLSVIYFWAKGVFTWPHQIRT
ncbi:MAG: NADH-quinone oxidoreductase subunit A [Desulfovibrionaceae bacterium]|nr:NADH-quinone oxidoreductase subunit A [Desulfovibrionaceae bacterium]MDD4952226.1 NADH-quinone oxidoreductase subunit A [Desulfovibrionaceae bacterium]